MNNRKTLILDIEATGDGSSNKHTILEIAGDLLIDNISVDKFYFKMKPIDGYKCKIGDRGKINYRKSKVHEGLTLTNEQGFIKFIK